MYRDVLGIRSIDAVHKKIEIAFADVPLQTCAGTMPIGTDTVTVNWRKEGDTFFYQIAAPTGFAVNVDTSRLPLKAIKCAFQKK